jgi:hypothetical protein
VESGLYFKIATESRDYLIQRAEEQVLPCLKARNSGLTNHPSIHQRSQLLLRKIL